MSLIREILEPYQFDPPPLLDEQVFEKFIVTYFNDLEQTTSYSRFGRKGQKQHGLDVYSSEKKTVIQCKLKQIRLGNDSTIRKKLLKELEKDFIDFQTYNKQKNNAFNRFVFVSTFHSDSHLDDKCIELSFNHSVRVEYWSWDDLKDKMLVETLEKYYNELFQFHKEHYNSSNLMESGGEIFEIDDNLPIIDQLYSYFKQSFKEINVLPTYLFINNPLFKNTKTFQPIYSSFTLTTNNEDLFHLMNSLKKNDEKIICTKPKFTEGVKDASRKLVYIANKLDENFIAYIRFYKKGITDEIPVVNQNIYNDAELAFKRLDYTECFASINNCPQDLSDKMRYAYLHYELGNYLESAELFDKATEQAKNQKKYIWHAIAKFNLSNMKWYVSWNKSEKPNHKKIALKVKDINIENVRKKLLRKTNQPELMDWILNLKFFYSQFYKIDKTFRKIRKHYYNQLKGGWSSNNYFQSFLIDFAQTEAFLKRNYIVFKHFSNFNELVGKFIEGMMASHALKDGQGGRLKQFNDYMLSILVFYGKAKETKMYIERYGLRELKYHPGKEEENTFLYMVSNHLTKFENISESLKKTSEENNSEFWIKYNETLSNLMVLLSYVNFESQDIEKVAQKLLKYLEGTNQVRRESIEFIALFINSKGHFFKDEILRGLLKLFLQKENYHSDSLIQAILKQYNKKSIKIRLPKKDEQRLISMNIGECTICRNTHYYKLLEPLYNSLEPDSQKTLQKRIKKKLDEKFDSEFYYIAVLHDVLNDKDEFFNEFIEFAQPKSSDTSKKGWFMGHKKNRFQKVDMLLNLSFKNGVDLTQQKFDCFRDLDPYYEWLFDIKNFNYDEFEPEWITEYPVKYYLEEFNKHPIIKKTLLKYLRNNRDKMIEKTLIDLEVLSQEQLSIPL